MAKGIPQYPSQVWNGLSGNLQRKSRLDNVPPDFRDWDQVVAEVIALQTTGGVTGPQGIQGVKGVDGATWYAGIGIPSNSIAIDGDLYLDTANGNVYKHVVGNFNLIGNIRGAAGAAGAQGVQGVQGATGAAGAAGAAGATGPAGPAGAAVPGMATLVPPVLTDFTWNNQGSATASVSNAVLVVAVPNTAGYSAKGLLIAAPGVPWTITARIHATYSQETYGFVGVCVRDSVSAKTVRYGYANAKFYAEKMTNDTTWNAYQYQYGMGGSAANSNWVRLRDDGTNRIASYSVDGVHWWQANTISRTDFLTPTHVGLMFDTYTGGDILALVSSWSLTTP